MNTAGRWCCARGSERGGPLVDVHSVVFKPMVKSTRCCSTTAAFTTTSRGSPSTRFPARSDRRLDLHRGQHPAQRAEQHHGPGFMLAMHETDYTLPESAASRSAAPWGQHARLRSGRAIMNAGYEDAMAAMPQLLEKSRSAATRRTMPASRGVPRKCPPLVFDDYKLEGLKRAQRDISAISCRWTAARRAFSGRWDSRS